MDYRVNDFITLFNAFWYRDFPVSLSGIDFAKRADWTTHIATSVRQVASLMGLFSCFESGGRTDAELQFANRKVWAKLEWEWEEPRDNRVGEIAKLAAAASDCDVCVYIGYSSTGHHEINLEKIRAAWHGVHKPLLVMLVTFELDGNWRCFDQLKTYSFDGHGFTLLREQPALPWSAPLSRWQVDAGLVG
ncbi:hypothetical protein [Pseudomonas amygdali]|uniref:hypothetical protein n=1 Tax=Pseudomonas amygdali TaxID=47877 RepID=UPI000C3455B3|nr:hypothetical protein [Pseudomonas amygdali]PWC98823.1 hypothetical protein CX658_31935 [Pseudomonas amygdali pv. lachrymans]